MFISEQNDIAHDRVSREYLKAWQEHYHEYDTFTFKQWKDFRKAFACL